MHPPFKSTERDPFVSEQYFSVGIHIQCLKRITFFFFLNSGHTKMHLAAKEDSFS